MIIIAVSVYKTFYYKPSLGKYADIEIDYVCTSCREVSLGRFIIDENPPHDCSKCGEKSMYSAYECQDCKKVTASLPIKVPLACMKCNHIHEADYPGIVPSACPKCESIDFWEPIYCKTCDLYFSAIKGRTNCPDCKKKETIPVAMLGPDCEHCGSQHLGDLPTEPTQK